MMTSEYKHEDDIFKSKVQFFEILKNFHSDFMDAN